MKGKITSVVQGKGFFFIDNVYFCRFSDYAESPVEGDEVEYQQITKADGKKAAKNVKPLHNSQNPIRNNSGIFQEYLDFFNGGYFDEDGYLKKELIVDFPKKLAEDFQKDNTKNKPSQIRKFYDSCKIIEGRYRMTRDYRMVKTELLKLLPQINNAKTKLHITPEFYTFMEKNIEEAANSAKDFEDGFLYHFEALIGYYKI